MATGETEPVEQRPPVPDPTTLTTEQLEKGLKAERDYVIGQIEVLKERLNGIDRATDLRLTGIGHTPGEMDEKIRCATELFDEKFHAVDQRFAERDTRSERESRDNKVAVDAAFAAQKEAAAKQDEANSKAIDKSETATAETINKLSQLFETNNRALSDKIDDLKARVGVTEASMVGIISTASGGSTATTEARAAAAGQRQIVTIGISAVLLIITIIGFVIALQAKP